MAESLAELNAQIASFNGRVGWHEEKIRTLKIARKKVISRRTLERLRCDPVFVAKQKAANMAHWESVQSRQHWAAECRARAMKSSRTLPPMTNAQRKQYKKLREYKVGREEAIAAVLA